MSIQNKQEKQAIIDEIKTEFDKASSVVAVDYLGLTVEEATKLRNNLRSQQVKFRVYKNTLIKRAIDGTEYEGLNENNIFSGSTALAFGSDDATAPARVISDAIKEFGKLAFKGGIVEGKIYDKVHIEDFAKIPSREVLVSRFMGSVKSPISKFTLTLKAYAEKMSE